MKLTYLLFTLASLITSAVCCADEFDDYPAESSLVGSPREPDVSTGKAHRYRTLLTNESREGVNFNGHMRIVHWGCGSNCIEWAILDLSSGSTWFDTKGAGSCTGFNEPNPNAVPDWTVSRPDSSLFYVYMCKHFPNHERVFDTRAVYVWRGGQPVLLREEPATY